MFMEENFDKTWWLRYRSNAHRWNKAGPPPHNITVAKGPVHMAASREFVDFCLHSTYALDFLEWIKKTDVPDESYFTTLNNQHQLGVPGAYTGYSFSNKTSCTDIFYFFIQRVE